MTFAITMLSLLFIAAPIRETLVDTSLYRSFGPFVGIIASTYFLNDHVTTGGLSAIAAVLRSRGLLENEGVVLPTLFRFRDILSHDNGILAVYR